MVMPEQGTDQDVCRRHPQDPWANCSGNGVFWVLVMCSLNFWQLHDITFHSRALIRILFTAQPTKRHIMPHLHGGYVEESARGVSTLCKASEHILSVLTSAWLFFCTWIISYIYVLLFCYQLFNIITLAFLFPLAHRGRLPSPFQGTSRARGTDGTDDLVRAKTVHPTILPQLSSYFFWHLSFHIFFHHVFFYIN